MRTGFRTIWFTITAVIALSLRLTAGSLCIASGGQVKTLDPVKADDLASRDLSALVYDTLLQYDYTVRPYKLIPSMLTRMPDVSRDFTRFEFELRDDLYFHNDRCFAGGFSRKVTAHDVKFSLLRFADVRNHSPVYWMFRGKIAGLEDFRTSTHRLKRDDLSPYDREIPGFTILSSRRFVITLNHPDPRFLYLFAIPNTGIVSRRGVEFYRHRFARNPVGSGPFILKQWINNLKLDFIRNPDYRTEYFPAAATPADSSRKLPLLDRIEICQIRQPMTAWMMFLQGRLDINVLDKDNQNQLLVNGELIPALKKRDIRLLRNPEFEIRYVGFNFDDPKFKNNPKLRQALSLAYNVQRRICHAEGQLTAVHSPIPHGVAGYDPEFRNPFAGYDLARAAQLLAEAGYPGGIDPETGKPLTLTFDQGGTDTAHRQMGELAADDWRMLGINVIPVLNSKPRFFDKLRRKRFQLFRLSWVGDYPDAENFLQLFYSGNRGSCNRTGFSDQEFDRLYEKALKLPDSPERTALYRRLAAIAAGECAWIFEGIPVTGMLHHGYVENYLPHDFTFVRWKYVNVNEKRKKELLRSFRPLSLQELSGK